MWLPSASEASNVVEEAARGILRHVLLEEAENFSGVEYWARCRSVNLGASLHFDAAVDAQVRDSHGARVLEGNHIVFGARGL